MKIIAEVTDITINDDRNVRNPTQRLCRLYIGDERFFGISTREKRYDFVFEFDQRRFKEYTTEIWSFLRSLHDRVDYTTNASSKRYDRYFQTTYTREWKERRLLKGKPGRRYVPLAPQRRYNLINFWVLEDENDSFTATFVNGLKAATDAVSRRRLSLKTMCLYVVNRYVSIDDQDAETVHMIKLISSQ